MWNKLKNWVKAQKITLLILFNLFLALGLSWTLISQLKNAQEFYLNQPAAILEKQEAKSDTLTAEATASPTDSEELERAGPLIRDTSEAKKEVAPAGKEKTGVSFLDLILLMFTAGALGGVLGNLRGFFAYYRDEGVFPEKLLVPYIVRPFAAAVCSLFAYFLASLLVVSITIEQVAVNITFQGMVSFMALGILAGFGSQEFMERVKATVKSIFGQKETADRMQQLEKLFQLNKTGVLSDEEFQEQKKKLLEMADVSIDYVPKGRRVQVKQ
jgi:hypothetical protein